MSTAAYDAKNEENFEAVTLALDAALKKMEKTLQSRPTQPSWPSWLEYIGTPSTIASGRLSVCKKSRPSVLSKNDEAAAKAQTRTPEELLELSRVEIVYWFTQVQDARAANTELLNNLRETEKARDMYMDDHQEALRVINQMRVNIRKLEHTIVVLQDEIQQLQGRMGG